MRGQWLGTYTSETVGTIMVNIDEVDGHFEVVAYIYPETRDLPSVVAYLTTENTNNEQEAKASIFPIHPHTGYQCYWEEIKSLYSEGVKFSNEAIVKLILVENKLNIKATSKFGGSYSADLNKEIGNGTSKIHGKSMSWPEFKSEISKKSNGDFLFRGQREPWPLCTSFHRRGRYRISEFTTKDVRQLHRRLSAITPHFFDLNVPDQNGAFFNLLQHHGYPTPLLDWSHSPFVAAFFAFRDLKIDYSGGDVVRIYIFNNRLWQKVYPQINNIDPPYPHLSVMEFIAIDNPRLVPQQAVTTVTNLHDIEAYILEQERKTDLKFLEAFDISANARAEVMRDLRFMGITAGSMFPSIDGVCEEMRERNFDK